VGNGGVRVWEDLEKLTSENRVDGWMVGEELGGNPRSASVLLFSSFCSRKRILSLNLSFSLVLRSKRFFTSTTHQTQTQPPLPLNPLSLATEYLDLVDLCFQAPTPLSNIKRHLRNFVEGNLSW